MFPLPINTGKYTSFIFYHLKNSLKHYTNKLKFVSLIQQQCLVNPNSTFSSQLATLKDATASLET